MATSKEKMLAAAILEKRRRKRERKQRRVGFKNFVDHVNPGYEWYPYLERLAEILERVAAGHIKRLMIFMPPRHGKSEIVSRMFSAYYLYSNPDHFVGVTSYAAELAFTFSRAARQNYQDFGGLISKHSASVKHWETPEGGGMWSAGVAGPITGKGGHLIIIDDPIKDALQAHSDVIRENQKEWYQSTLSTRFEPDSSMIVIQTRWHPDDLSGWLLTQEEEVEEKWKIVSMEAIKEEETWFDELERQFPSGEPGRPKFLDTCFLYPDNRQVGEALSPERYDREELDKIEKRVGNYYWSALYQQRPRPKDGAMFERGWFSIFPSVPGPVKKVARVISVDKAGSKDVGAYTAFVLMAYYNGRYYIEHVKWGQWEAAKREKELKNYAKFWNEKYGYVPIILEQEPGSGGKESAQATVKNLDGFTVIKDIPKGDKVLRAEPLAVQSENGSVYLIRGDWNARYLDEIVAFPLGKVKDAVDATSAAYNFLRKSATGGLTKEMANYGKKTSLWREGRVGKMNPVKRWRVS